MAATAMQITGMITPVDSRTPVRRSVTGITRDGAALLIALDGAAGALTLEVRPADSGRPAYRTVGAHAYSYRGWSGTLPPDRQRLLQTVIVALSRVLPRIGDMSRDDGFWVEALTTAVSQSTADADEGLRAFLEKRPPDFRGE